MNALTVPFLDKIGATVHALGDDQVEVRLTIAADLLNTWEVLQGGVTMTLLDVAMGAAVRVKTPDAMAIATVDMSTQFMLPAGVVGDTVIAIGKVNHRTNKLFFCEATLWNQSRAVAKSTGIFKEIKFQPTTDKGL